VDLLVHCRWVQYGYNNKLLDFNQPHIEDLRWHVLKFMTYIMSAMVASETPGF
jgi:hypothetical protein